jgi:decaprenylphospho-beta-D-ribofuranose 2-oxidase
LDSIKNWNKIYGKNGFIQYQCVLPIGTSQVGLEKILDIVSQHSTPPFLTVLKLLGEANKESPWSFPMEGFTIAMDFKIHKGIEALIQNLDNIVNEYDGRVYLAKDAMSSKDVIVKPTITSSKFSSVQSKRLS